MPKVVLITREGLNIGVWNSRIIRDRTRVVLILPGQFSDVMFSMLGWHRCKELTYPKSYLSHEHRLEGNGEDSLPH